MTCSAVCPSEGFAASPEMKNLLSYLQNQAGISHPDQCWQLVHTKPWGCKCCVIPAALACLPGQGTGQWTPKIPSLLHHLALHAPATSHPQADPTEELKAFVQAAMPLTARDWGHIHAVLLCWGMLSSAKHTPGNTWCFQSPCMYPYPCIYSVSPSTQGGRQHLDTCWCHGSPVRVR